MPPTPPTRDDLIRGFLRGRGRPNLNIPGARRRRPPKLPSGGGGWRTGPRKPAPRGGKSAPRLPSSAFPPPRGAGLRGDLPRIGSPPPRGDLPRIGSPTLKRY